MSLAFLWAVYVPACSGLPPWEVTFSPPLHGCKAWCDYRRMHASGAMHQAVCRFFHTTLCGLEMSMRAAYALSHHLPCSK